MKDMTGKVAFVTGGASGIGLGMARGSLLFWYSSITISFAKLLRRRREVDARLVHEYS
jgi:NADP-dependent 3-hydroxy acid dehydrogenase YdfG